MTGGHGHVTPRPDGAKARCGGPAMCSVCAAEKAQYEASKLRVADMIAPSVSDAKKLDAHMELIGRYGDEREKGKGASLLLREIEASTKRLMGLAE